jgi:predicted SAM-dependent methyltransferase
MSEIISKLNRIKKRLYRRSNIESEMKFGRGETSKCRSRLAKYCEGYGVDLGFGGDPILLSAIRMDMVQPYTKVGNFPVQLGGKAEDLYWFKDAVLDYVFSSHLLEDFFDTEAVLREWIRVLKPRGKLVIFCPDEQRFRKHCKETGQLYNTAHVHDFFSLEYVKNVLNKIAETKVIYEQDNVDIYSWDLVCERI